MSCGSSDDESSAGVSWHANSPVSTNIMNKLVLDYLLSEGYKDAADKFVEETGMQEDQSGQIDSHIDQRMAIKKAIMEGDMTGGMDLLNNLLPELLDDSPSLHFHLLLQQLIELIRQGNVDNALEFAQNRLAEKGQKDATHLQELQTALALLAFEKPEESPYAHLLEVSHRQRVANEVNGAVLEGLQLSGTPKMETLVKMVMWSQDQLDHKRINYPRITDIPSATITNTKKSTSFAPRPQNNNS